MLLAVATVSVVLAAAGITAFAFQLASEPARPRSSYFAGWVARYCRISRDTALLHARSFMLHSRSNLNFVPVRDVNCYVSYNRTVFLRDA